MASDRWKIISVTDGLVEWRLAGSGIRQALVVGPDTSECRIRTHDDQHWCSLGDLRFSAIPSAARSGCDGVVGRHAAACLGVEHGQALQVALDDVIAWWWRDPWYRVRADARLAGLLISVVDGFRPVGAFHRSATVFGASVASLPPDHGHRARIGRSLWLVGARVPPRVCQCASSDTRRLGSTFNGCAGLRSPARSARLHRRTDCPPLGLSTCALLSVPSPLR